MGRNDATPSDRLPTWWQRFHDCAHIGYESESRNVAAGQHDELLRSGSDLRMGIPLRDSLPPAPCKGTPVRVVRDRAREMRQADVDLHRRYEDAERIAHPSEHTDGHQSHQWQVLRRVMPT